MKKKTPPTDAPRVTREARMQILRQALAQQTQQRNQLLDQANQIQVDLYHLEGRLVELMEAKD